MTESQYTTALVASILEAQFPQGLEIATERLKIAITSLPSFRNTEYDREAKGQLADPHPLGQCSSFDLLLHSEFSDHTS